MTDGVAGEDELDVLDPEVVTINAGGETIEVSPLTIGQLPKFLRCIKDADIDLSDDVDVDVLALIADGGEDIIDAVAVAVDRAPEFISTLDLEEFTEITAAVLHVNMDFFARRLAPKLQSLMTTVGSALGRGLSANSSQPDTATQM